MELEVKLDRYWHCSNFSSLKYYCNKIKKINGYRQIAILKNTSRSACIAFPKQINDQKEITGGE
jgi:hypothetical protein